MATLTDTFNRADSATLGAPWLDIYGTVGVTSNAADHKTGTTAHVVHTTQLDTSDHSVEVTNITQGVPLRRFGTMARVSADYETYYIGRYSEGNYEIHKSLAGSWTLLGTTATSDTYPFTRLKLICDGSSITLESNGIEVLSATDSAIPSGRMTGMYFRNFGGLVDGFEATDLSVVTPTDQPYRTVAGHVYVPGCDAGQVYAPGVRAGQVYVPGTVAGQVHT